MNRMPLQLPANPDLLLDGTQEPAPPDNGVDDHRPTTLKGELELSQSGTEKPVWNGNQWGFTGGTHWDGTYQKKVFSGAMVWVGTHESGDNGFLMRFNNSDGDEIRINAHYSSSFVRALIPGTHATINVNPQNPFVLVAGFDLRNNHISLVFKNASTLEYTTASPNTSPVLLTDFYVGARGDGAFGVNGDLYELQSYFNINTISDGELKRLAVGLANKHNIDQKSTSGFRQSIHLPAPPDIHMDASQEVDPPSDGGGEESPLNLSSTSSLDLSQSVASNQPIWRDGPPPYWEYTGQEYFETRTKGYTSLTMAGVAKHGGPDGDRYRSFAADHTTNPSRVWMRLWRTGQSSSFLARDINSNATSVSTNTGVTDLFVFLVTIDYDEIYLTDRNPNKSQSSSGTSPDRIVVNNWGVGTSPGSTGRQHVGPIYEFYLSLGTAVSQAEGDQYVDYLFEKWNRLLSG